ncbi:MAG TPA: LCP family protein [Acidimicrobiales bacterium]
MSDVPPTSGPGADAPDPGPSRRRHARPARRGRRVLTGMGVLAVLAVVAVVAALGYGWYRYNQIGRKDLALADSAGAVQNFLVVGSDTRAVIDADDPNDSAFGHEAAGQRSDTIMIARVDPKAKTIDLMSFPRDLWVPIMPSGDPERINTAYNTSDPEVDGAQRLIDTIDADFGIDIHHYVEIDFASFKGVVDAVGGVPMFFETGVRDRKTGLYQYELGCQTLDGEQALAFARSRNLEYNTSKGWEFDPSADLGRITRQQYFMKEMVDQAQSEFGSLDLKAINDIISSTSDQLKLDDELSLGDMVDLAKAFKGFSGDQIRSHSLPVLDVTTSGGARVLKLDTARAEETLNVFRGLPPGTVSPASVTLAVSNGSGAKNQATDVSNRLAGLGYEASIAADTTRTQARTIVRYAPGLQAQADQVARQLASGAELQVDKSLSGAKVPVVLVTGTDFTTVLDQASPPTSSTSTTAPASSSTSSRGGGSTTSTTVAEEITGPVGYQIGEPPAGQTCG